MDDFLEYFRIMTDADGDPFRQRAEEAMARAVYGRFTEISDDESRPDLERQESRLNRDALVACLQEFVRARDLAGASWQRRFLDEYGIPVTGARKPS